MLLFLHYKKKSKIRGFFQHDLRKNTYRHISLEVLTVTKCLKTALSLKNYINLNSYIVV